MEVALIAAIARNRVIGRDNHLPWRLPADLRHFRDTTMGKPIIMGRHTYDSIGRPLPGRTNVVLTHDPDFAPPGILVARSLVDALAKLEPAEEGFVIGGAAIFTAAMSLATRLHLTVIEHDFDGDVYFPPLTGTWRLAAEERFDSDDKNAWPYRFLLLECAPDDGDGFDLDPYLGQL